MRRAPMGFCCTRTPDSGILALELWDELLDLLALLAHRPEADRHLTSRSARPHAVQSATSRRS